MENFPTIAASWMPVVAVAIRNEAGLWFLQKRPKHKDHSGLWEFPGGKVEPSETPVNALIRELSEELAISVSEPDLHPATFAQSATRDDRLPIVILLYIYLHFSGEAVSQEGAEIGWFTKEQVDDLPKPPLDVDLARQLFGHGY